MTLFDYLQAARTQVQRMRDGAPAVACPVTLTGVHIYRHDGEDKARAYCGCGASRARDGVPIDIAAERERRRPREAEVLALAAEIEAALVADPDHFERVPGTDRWRERSDDRG